MCLSSVATLEDLLITFALIYEAENIGILWIELHDAYGLMKDHIIATDDFVDWSATCIFFDASLAGARYCYEFNNVLSEQSFS